ncbi:MAG: hypothetical protein ABWY25_06280 [Paenisporosarcina sp.]
MIKERYDQVKAHVKRHEVVYSCVATGIVVATFTTIIMRGVASQHIRGAIGVPTQRTIGVLGKNVVISNVSYISANRQGPPSWVVRCKETGNIFTSQAKAAFEMGLPKDHLSNHLNGARDNVGGFTFERICMAA